MRQLVKETWIFWSLYLIFLLAGAFLLIIIEKGDIVLWVNHHHNLLGDWFFYYATTVGNGWTLALVALGLLLYRYRYGIIAGVAFILQGVIIQLLKRLVFPEHFRPLKYFDSLPSVNLVPGAEVNSFFAFPSGHSGSAFCLFCILALIVRKPFWQFIFIILAIAVGFSRIYLFQHFFEDVFVGSLIGTIIAFLIFVWLEYYSPNILQNKKWWKNKGLLV